MAVYAGVGLFNKLSNVSSLQLTVLPIRAEFLQARPAAIFAVDRAGDGLVDQAAMEFSDTLGEVDPEIPKRIPRLYALQTHFGYG